MNGPPCGAKLADTTTGVIVSHLCLDLVSGSMSLWGELDKPADMKGSLDSFTTDLLFLIHAVFNGQIKCMCMTVDEDSPFLTSYDLCDNSILRTTSSCSKHHHRTGIRYL